MPDPGRRRSCSHAKLNPRFGWLTQCPPWFEFCSREWGLCHRGLHGLGSNPTANPRLQPPNPTPKRSPDPCGKRRDRFASFRHLFARKPAPSTPTFCVYAADNAWLTGLMVLHTRNFHSRGGFVRPFLITSGIYPLSWSTIHFERIPPADYGYSKVSLPRD